LLVIFYVLVCIFLILVVLLQQGKGADLAGAFGGGGSQTSFGPRSASNIMHRMTTVSFVLFVVLSLALAILSGKQGTSVMESVEIPEEPVAEAPAPTAEEPAIDAAVDPVADEGAAAADETGGEATGLTEDDADGGDTDPAEGGNPNNG
jgi:preprotein translocase subunit SecG